MKHDKFHAVADVWAVPKPHSSKYYKKDWGKNLFSCRVTVDPDEGQSSLLHVRLEDRKSHTLIADAPYDGQHGITSVVDSAKHFVLVIRNHNLEAWLGIGFRDRADSVGFSLAIQSFMRRRMFEQRLDSPGWSQRRSAGLMPRKPVSAMDKADAMNGHDKAQNTAPLISPPPTESPSSSSSSSMSSITESSDDEDFGEFQ